ncbi:GNAT family N-acetyltransferase [Gulosibacter sp. ACHW.36C]|uniref:GNAT family N-acetyltransferase n=1 Tax=Gulosibacter sediminis TaxID=1729695 RepID=A0ABY4N0N0_9MICO|nr:GNAT family protein [Gulosibacter sediminis]UQN14773.1 GNAT family N-acetyltransferase [Gulosibacter sediminis]
MTFFTHPLDHRTALHLVAVEDAEELAEVLNANRERIGTWEDWAREPQPLERQREFLRGQLQKFVGGTSLPCFIKVDGRLAGSIELRQVSAGDRVSEIGYWVSAEFEGQGLVRRACEAFIAHAFGPLERLRVELQIAADNERSCGLAERLGFTEEGTRRSAMVVGDRRHDLVWYGLLASEWRG